MGGRRTHRREARLRRAIVLIDSRHGIKPVDVEIMDMLDNVVFSTGIVDAGDRFIVASGEADLACRITHIPKERFR